MRVANKSLVVLLIGFLAAAFASQVSAQPDVNAPPENPTKISEHRAAALEKCTSGQPFASEQYVACMLNEDEAP